MSSINLQCGEAVQLYGVRVFFAGTLADGSVNLTVNRHSDWDDKLAELAADNEFLRFSLQSYEQGKVPGSQREEAQEQRIEQLTGEVARLTAQLARARKDKINDAVDQIEARREEPRNLPCDPFQNPDAWIPPKNAERCECGIYTGGHNPCKRCREAITA